MISVELLAGLGAIMLIAGAMAWTEPKISDWLKARNMRLAGFRVVFGPRVLLMLVGAAYSTLAIISPPVAGEREGGIIALVLVTVISALAWIHEGKPSRF